MGHDGANTGDRPYAVAQAVPRKATPSAPGSSVSCAAVVLRVEEGGMDARRTAIGGSTVMTATEATEWIAHRQRMTWLEVNAEQREYEDWCLTLDGSAIRKAAQAMASGLPEHRLWGPAPADAPGGRAGTGPSYLHQMSAPGSRAVLEIICARLEQRFGRPISFTELAERVEPETARLLARFQARREALAALIDAARGGQLIADGKPDGEDGLPRIVDD